MSLVAAGSLLTLCLVLHVGIGSWTPWLWKCPVGGGVFLLPPAIYLAIGGGRTLLGSLGCGASVVVV